MSDEPFVFEGFEPANTTPVPDVLFDVLLSKLSGAELKVLLYIIRRTRGFKKDTDAISLTQFEKGIITKDGRVLDEGCGLNRETICKALQSLEDKGCIKSQKRSNARKEKDTTIYSVRFKAVSEVVGKTDYIQSEKPTRVVEKDDYSSRKNPTEVVGKTDRQETVQQETVQQESTLPSVATTPTASSDDEDAHALSLSSEQSEQEAYWAVHTAIPAHVIPVIVDAVPVVSCSLCSEQEDIQPCRECGIRLCFEHRRDFPQEGKPTRILCVECLRQQNRAMVEQRSASADTDELSALAPIAKAEPLIANATPTSQPAPPKAARKPRTPKPVVEAVVTGPAPKPPLPDASMAWGTRKCLLKFDAWREAKLIAKHKIIQASECAKALSETYTEEQIDRVYAAMNADAYYIERGGADIFDVASNIAKYLRKLDRKLVAVPSSPPPSGPRPLTDLQARNKALREKYGQPGKKEVITHGA